MSETKDRIEILKLISEDMRKDAEHFDGQPFTGKTVAEYFGNQGAAISALANIMRTIIVELDTLKKNRRE